MLYIETLELYNYNDELFVELTVQGKTATIVVAQNSVQMYWNTSFRPCTTEERRTITTTLLSQRC